MLFCRFQTSLASLRPKDASFNAFVFFAETLNFSPMKGPLNGCKIAIKDNICTSALPTTCGSAMLRLLYLYF